MCVRKTFSASFVPHPAEKLTSQGSVPSMGKTWPQFHKMKKTHIQKLTNGGTFALRKKKIVKTIPLGGSLFLGSLGSNGMRRSLGSPNWSCGGPLNSAPGGPRKVKWL